MKCFIKENFHSIIHDANNLFVSKKLVVMKFIFDELIYGIRIDFVEKEISLLIIDKENKYVDSDDIELSQHQYEETIKICLSKSMINKKHFIDYIEKQASKELTSKEETKEKKERKILFFRKNKS